MQGRVQVALLGVEPGQERDLTVRPQQGLGMLGEFDVAAQVGGGRAVLLAGLGEPLGGVRTDGLQQPVADRAGLPAGGAEQGLVEQGLVEQGGEQVLDRGRVGRGAVGPVLGADQVRVGEGGAAGEHGEAAQQHAFVLGEQLPAPVDHGAQGAVPVEGRAGAAVEQPEPVVQPVRDLTGGQGAQPGRGQFEGQRQAVELAADPDHRVDGVVVHGEAGAGRGGALREERDGGVRERPLRSVAGCGHGERRDRPERLAGDAERLAAGGEHGEPGCGGQQALGEAGRVLDQVLAVVQDQQDVPARHGPGDPLDGPGRVSRAGGHSGVRRRAEGRQHGPRHAVRAGGVGEFGQPDVRGGQGRGGGGEGQPGLADAARAGQGDQPGAAQAFLNGRQVGVPADQGGEPAGEDGGPGVRERRGGGQHRQVGVAELGGRVGAQLLGQRPPGPLEHLQRRRLLAVRVQGADQPGGGPLAQRVGGAEAGELGDQSRQRVGGAEREQGVGAGLDRREPQLRQPGGRCGRERGVPGVRERRPAPQVERPAQVVGGFGEAARVERRPSRGDPVLEVPGVHVRPGQVQQVPGGVRGEHGPVGAERSAQAGHQGLHRAGGLRGRGVRPEVVHQPVAGDDPPRVERQPDQQQPQPRPAHLDGRALAAPEDLKWPQQVDPHVARPSFRTARSRSLSRSAGGRGAPVGEAAVLAAAVLEAVPGEWSSARAVRFPARCCEPRHIRPGGGKVREGAAGAV